MPVTNDVLHLLRTWGRLGAGDLAQRLRISRPTLMRAVQALGPQIVARGAARRRGYAARRAVRGRLEPFALYRISPAGQAQEVATLFPAHPHGCAMEYRGDFDWPLDAAMADGWFDGLPYPLEDLRPQGFLGRNFAQANAALLQVPGDPRLWSEDDVLHALSVLGSDQPGAYVLGEPSLRHWLAQSATPPQALSDADIEQAYPELAAAAMSGLVAGSSAGGEFPKFPAVRQSGDTVSHVLVKFSGSDNAAGTRRWGDLLVCEQLAAVTVREALGIDAVQSTLHRFGGRTFLEVRRFDRIGARGRSPVCSWFALNAGLFGMAGKSWSAAADALHARGYIDAETKARISTLWHFGQLIANTDMHDGNLSFVPGLRLAPVYDMLPMLYAPERGMELPARSFTPHLPLPAERDNWGKALAAARVFWSRAAADRRITAQFRAICEENAGLVQRL